MTYKPVSHQEIEEKIGLYDMARNNYQVKKSQLIAFLLDAGYQFYDNVYDYSEEGVLISPQLLESEDWKEYARFDEEDEVWHIDEATSLPTDEGYTDWNAGYHIIEL